ncbi:glycosyltransferase family 2 protein [candidate division WOR-3 bacterium]|nr:glycosyltransferase family 2 protein [candidate division WOR-3 bacterium]
MASISVVVPVYNEDSCLRELHARLTDTLAALTDRHEIVFVDDGSRDNSWTVIAGLAAQDNRVRGLRLSRNFGQHHGITAGLDHCDGDWVVIMDADLQDRPEEIPRLLARAREGYDVVLAQRGRRRHPLPSRLTSWVFARVFSYFTGMVRDEQVGTFRVMSRRVVENLRRMREQLRFLGGMTDWLGFPTAKLPVRHDQRAAGRTSYSLRRRWLLAKSAIVAYSDKPLALTVRLGFFIAGLAFLYGGFVVVRALVHRVAVPGWSSLIVSLYFIGGIIIATLGIVGIYLERTFSETKRRPLYVLKEMVNTAGSAGRDEQQ